jgi:hypothetical protein
LLNGLIALTHAGGGTGWNRLEGKSSIQNSIHSIQTILGY